MLGAIIGDVVGSRYEFYNYRGKDFELFHPVCRFTDDTVCTMAVAKTLIDHYPIEYNDEYLEIVKNDLIANLVKFGRNYPDRGYGSKYFKWLHGVNGYKPYNSFGNGSAMRVSSVGWLANSEKEVKTLSKLTAEVTHNHKEGIKGAEAVAMCIYLARIGKTKKEIKEYIYEYYYPEINYFKYEELRKTNTFDVTCQGSVPEAIYCFLISKSFTDAIKIAISIGGDSDTIACMAGSIAEAYYKDKTNMDSLTKRLYKEVEIPEEFKEIINKFLEITAKV